MVERLDDVCGQLSYESNLFLLSEYLATGVSWLRAEYELEKDADEGQRWIPTIRLHPISNCFIFCYIGFLPHCVIYRFIIMYQ